MNREDRRRVAKARGRRVRGIAGMSLVATSGLLGAYLGNPRMPRAYADVPTCAAYDTDTLNLAISDLNDGLCPANTITVTSDITLDDYLTAVDLDEDLIVTGSGSTAPVIDGNDGSYPGFNFDSVLGASVTVSDLTIRNTYGAGIRLSGSDAPPSQSDLTLSSVTVDDMHTYAVLFVGGSLTVTDSTFSDNSESNEKGGALFVEDADSVSVTSSTFQDNYARYSGGAIYLYSGSLEVSHSTFAGNFSDDAAGGAIYAGERVSTVDISYSTFTGNHASSYGGAVDVQGDGLTTVSHSSFSGNAAYGTWGAALLVGSDLSVDYSTFTNNNATIGSAALMNGPGTLTVRRSTFAGNQAYWGGAAIVDYSGLPATIVNSTFQGNSANLAGGAVYLAAGGAVDFCTFAGNVSAFSNGGGLFSAAAVSVTNSVFWGNTALDGDDVYASDDDFTAYDSLFTATDSIPVGGTQERLLFGEDPLLGSLADNGGPTQTMLPAAGSPALDLANPDGAPSTDQRGYARVVDGKADMGAVQASAAAPVPDLSQVPPSWHQASGRSGPDVPCPDGTAPSWDSWPNDGTGGWTCEWTTWWDVTKGTSGGWVTSPGYRGKGKARHVFRYHAAG